MKKIDLVTDGKITREKLIDIPKNRQGILLQLIENQNELMEGYKGIVNWINHGRVG